MLSTRELKQIHLHRQHLTDRADKLTVCRDLNGVQSQFMVNAAHSLKIRCTEPIRSDTFGEGLVKNWSIRGTIHVFGADDLPVQKYADERNPYFSHDWGETQLCAQYHCAITPDRLEYLARLIISMVADGITAREDIKRECYAAGVTEPEGLYIFDQWGGLLRPLCERGFLCYKVQEKKEFGICPPYTPMERDDAHLEQARRYFEHIAPATLRDASYYFGWTQAYVKQIMQKLPIEQITADGKQYYYIGELRSGYPDIPKCIFLSGFDQLMLGYQKSDSIYLPQTHLRGIFNLAGIVMPPILLDGAVVGRWRKKSAKMTFELFEEISSRKKKYIETAMDETFGDIRKVEWAQL